MKKYIAKNPSETMAIASQIAKKLKGGEVLGLVGNLGSGKTVFVQGLAKSLGVKKIVNSPTFVLMKIYECRLLNVVRRVPYIKVKQIQKTKQLSTLDIRFLVHVDAYRINNYQGLLDIGLGEYLGRKDTLVVIEWADRVPEIKKIPGYREIEFIQGNRENIRVITIKN